MNEIITHIFARELIKYGEWFFYFVFLTFQYDMQIAKLKAEQAVIQDQMTKDRATVERLEMLLDQARQESITAQTNNQELQNEMSRLRQKMSELQTKL